jgi:integrase
MPRHPLFAYSHHKATGQAFVRVDGRIHYLGKYGTPESRVRHRNIVAAAQARREAFDLLRPLSVGELCERFVAAMQREHGPRSWQDIEARAVALTVCAKHAGMVAAAFGPKALQDIQQAMLKADRLTRYGINRRKQHIVAMFKWAVSEELVPPSAWHALQAVRALRRGKGRDNPPRVPADPVAVDAVVAKLQADGNTGAALCVRFMRSTGCRPSEAYGATPADLRLSDPLPTCIVREHKNAHRGMDRVLPLNAAAVAAVREALAARPSTQGLLFPNGAGNRWDNRTLPRMIVRACEALGIPPWTPYQLRHLAATEAVNRTGNEAAVAAMLGHAPDSTVVRRYSVNRLQLAAQAAQAVGA